MFILVSLRDNFLKNYFLKFIQYSKPIQQDWCWFLQSKVESQRAEMVLKTNIETQTVTFLLLKRPKPFPLLQGISLLQIRNGQ